MGIPIQDQDLTTGLDQSGRRCQPAQSRADDDDIGFRSVTYQNGKPLFGSRLTGTAGLTDSPSCCEHRTVGSVPVR